VLYGQVEDIDHCCGQDEDIDQCYMDRMRILISVVWTG
jgi:hypothetical protein